MPTAGRTTGMWRVLPWRQGAAAARQWWLLSQHHLRLDITYTVPTALTGIICHKHT